MALYNVSTLTMTNSMISNIQKKTNEFHKLSKEVLEGKHYDMGLELGANHGTTISLRNDYESIEKLLLSNSQTDMRLEAAYTAMETSRETAESFKAELVGLRDSGGTLSTAGPLAMANLDALLGQLNTNVGGVFVFGGQNVSNGTANEFTDAMSATVDGWLDDFMATEGIADRGSMTQADMEKFLQNDFKTNFDAMWEGQISNATDDVMKATVGDGTTIDSTVSANDQAFKDVAAAYVMLGVFGSDETLSEGAQAALIDDAILTLESGGTAMTAAQAQVGSARSTLENSDEYLKAEKTLLNTFINDLENVDMNQVGVELTAVETQLENLFAITNRMRSLSLLNHL
ncbi:flagellar hook-associated family protein [Rhodobacteraceae bacterium RKSG542]|uniref:flagellar hook-associated family protein n=1 Tax=Pseudovibrio flavus TaxID=2529854 RepID=UPI0012BC137C|nr:flagellar hook-associated family protein [Pseudovibrio flavus]MTI16766.1 flagellar hook-associated family protein [Pseudovibrio flavus]